MSDHSDGGVEQTDPVTALTDAIDNNLDDDDAPGAPVGPVVEEMLSDSTIDIGDVAHALKEAYFHGVVYQPSQSRVARVATDGGEVTQEVEHEKCARCGGRIDPTEPGHYKSVDDETFLHSVCFQEGEPSKVLDLTDEYSFKEHVPRQYGCGHTASGPPIKLPTECPECEVPAP